MENALYQELILELSRNPLNKGVLQDYDVSAQDFNTSCGDDVTIYIKFSSDGKAEEVSHNGQGCAISTAAVSLLTEEVKGKTKDEMLAISTEKMIELLNIPISHTRLNCALLGLKTLQSAVNTKKL